MKNIVFDTGPIITLSLNNLLWLLEPLKKKANARFIIPDAVKVELIDRPLKTKKFKFEAMRTTRYIRNKILEIKGGEDIEELTTELLELANHCFKAKGQWIKIVHYAEIEALALAIKLKARVIVIDERTTKQLMENPKKLKETLARKLHTSIHVNKNYLKRFLEKTKGIKTLRSVELVTIAYEIGLLDKYLADIPEARRNLLDSVLWGVKLSGCAVSTREIDQIIKIEKPFL
ncbi:MAG: hypothetical protein KAS15_04370 [Nanoarchaeota archaeon]|nr:hypothetical protein [Nanoarchaeota archaeon]MCK5629303.1 hypothetical protein [Nanoarchaeota archaeon]